MDPVDFVKESKQLEEYIQKLSLNQPIMQPLPAAGAGGYGGGRTPGGQGGDQISVPCHIYILIALSLSRISITQEDFSHLGADLQLCVCCQDVDCCFCHDVHCNVAMGAGMYGAGGAGGGYNSYGGSAAAPQQQTSPYGAPPVGGAPYGGGGYGGPPARSPGGFGGGGGGGA